MNKTYLKYNEEGLILGYIGVPYSLLEVDGAIQESTHFVDVETRTVHPKQECQPLVSLATDNLRVAITNLPVPCILRILGNSDHRIDDGAAELTFQHAGEYEIMIESVKFLTWKGKITL